MTDNMQSSGFSVGRRKSFYGLFVNDSYTIKIPKMQRDYAQGRKTAKEIREAFLDAIYKHLEEGLPNRDLDFVYGSVTQKGKALLFIPLDGQQRLTTLFLLHWYLAWRTGRSDHFNAALLEEGNIARFTYETRPSSGEFCDGLLSRMPRCEEVLSRIPSREEVSTDEECLLSTQIQKLSWFRLSWNNDPTVASMLTMLDAIHEKFHTKNEFYDRLVDPEKPVITFFLLGLKDSRLTDELYIKMNARGKALTPFEVFKATLEKDMPAMGWPDGATYTLQQGNDAKKLSPWEYFAIKIDTSWADLFWQYRDTEKNVFDTELMNFIQVMLTFHYLSAYIVHKDTNERAFAETAREHLLDTNVARQNKDYQPVLSYRRLETLKAISAEGITLLIGALDALENGTRKIKSRMSPDYAFYYDEEQAFVDTLEKGLGHQDRVLFYAYISFLIHGKGDCAGLDEWMRVMRNLIRNSNIDGTDEVMRAVKSIDALLRERGTVLHFLSSECPDKIAFFYSGQCLEECIKARLILLLGKEGTAWGKAIREAEKNSYFAGQIGFILGFCGLIKAYLDGTLAMVAKEALPRFITYTHKVNAVFPRPDNDTQFAWERAVLSQGDYPLQALHWRRHFLSKPGSKARDYSWKRFFRLPQTRDNEDAKKDWVELRSYAQAVFDRQEFDPAKAEESLKQLCCPAIGNWRDNVIVNPALIAYCEQGFFREFHNENEEMKSIYLYKHSRISHTHVEMFSYDFYLREMQGKTFPPFPNVWYHSVTSEDDIPCAVLSEWPLENCEFELDIYGEPDANKAGIFYLRFISSDPPLEPKKYPDALRECLSGQKFAWDDEHKVYCCKALPWDKTVRAIARLCKALQTLTAGK